MAQKTNPVLQEAVARCEEAARVNDAPIWQRVADELQAAARQQRAVNLSRINRATSDGETVVVPGKVLGAGTLDHAVTVAALQFSDAAREQIAANGTAQYIDELMAENPDGAGVTVIG